MLILGVSTLGKVALAAAGAVVGVPLVAFLGYFVFVLLWGDDDINESW